MLTRIAPRIQYNFEEAQPSYWIIDISGNNNHGLILGTGGNWTTGLVTDNQ